MESPRVLKRGPKFVRGPLIAFRGRRKIWGLFWGHSPQPKPQKILFVSPVQPFPFFFQAFLGKRVYFFVKLKYQNFIPRGGMTTTHSRPWGYFKLRGLIFPPKPFFNPRPQMSYLGMVWGLKARGVIDCPPHIKLPNEKGEVVIFRFPKGAPGWG